MEVQIFNFVQYWFEDEDSARVMASSRHFYSVRRRRDGSNLHWHQKRQKTKLYFCAQSTSSAEILN